MPKISTVAPATRLLSVTWNRGVRRQITYETNSRGAMSRPGESATQNFYARGAAVRGNAQCLHWTGNQDDPQTAEVRRDSRKPFSGLGSILWRSPQRLAGLICARWAAPECWF